MTYCVGMRLDSPRGTNLDKVTNMFEAESRRQARFFRLGHTPGRMQAGAPVPDGEYPFTLDLRRFR